MDIRLLLDRPTAAEREAVDRVLGSATSDWDGGGPSPADGHVARGGRATRRRRHLLLPALHAVQDESGSISRGALGYICERLSIPPAEAYGVATFYALFDTGKPRAPVMVHVCDDLVCMRRGGAELRTRIEETLGPEREGAGERSWGSSPCLGQCDRAPAALVHTAGTGYETLAPYDGVTSQVTIGQDRGELTLLRRVGVVDPASLDSYRAAGGYSMLDRAIGMGPEGVIASLEISGLRGRGGAAFPIGAKWRGVAEAMGPDKFVIANADESEPGTFKDRVLMEGDPFALIEALTIAGFATGATKGFIYVRGEYPVAETLLAGAVAQAYEAGLLGRDVAGAGFTFELELRRGAGAYICGEETALFASIEGHRGEPRQKPPFPTEKGLFGRPTAVNNVETLVAVLAVLEMGAETFASIGTERSKGPKLFCVSGDVTRPGVYEVPFGTTLRHMLDLAGVGGSGRVGAVLVGGAAGAFVGPESLDMELTFEGAGAVGAGLGSGALIVFDDETDFGPVLARIARFFRDESCGQCVPCRIGTVRQEEALVRIATGRTLGGLEEERTRLGDLARVMTDASICGLGQTASTAIQSAMRLGLAGAP
ncbi:MAG: NAD(P)H-dependent oxidoreductase subunit E [Actinobacteria bacterium]|nr:NAD(P)H-dependent oxidoreductase subunit E [Actinomycetota bacterium]